MQKYTVYIRDVKLVSTEVWAHSEEDAAQFATKSYEDNKHMIFSDVGSFFEIEDVTPTITSDEMAEEIEASRKR